MQREFGREGIFDNDFQGLSDYILSNDNNWKHYKDFLKFTDKFEEYRLRNEDGDELLQEDDGSSDYFFNLFGNKVNKNVRDLMKQI